MHRLERVLARLATTEAPEALMRRRAELVLAQVAHIAVAVLIANDRACYVDANAAAERLTGHPRSELLRMAIWDLTPGSPGLGHRLWRDFLRRGRMRSRYQIRRKEGTVVLARYASFAHVLPGVHASALSTPPLVAALAARSCTAGQRP
jgi:PAS domain S-box-containing protein